MKKTKKNYTSILISSQTNVIENRVNLININYLSRWNLILKRKKESVTRMVLISKLYNQMITMFLIALKKSVILVITVRSKNIFTFHKYAKRLKRPNFQSNIKLCIY